MITFDDIMAMAEQAQKAGIETEDVNFWKRKKKIKQNMTYKTITVTIVCDYCGEIRHNAREGQRFCSKRCSAMNSRKVALENMKKRVI